MRIIREAGQLPHYDERVTLPVVVNPLYRPSHHTSGESVIYHPLVILELGRQVMEHSNVAMLLSLFPMAYDEDIIPEPTYEAPSLGQECRLAFSISPLEQ